MLGVDDNERDGSVECIDDGMVEGGVLELFCVFEEGALDSILCFFLGGPDGDGEREVGFLNFFENPMK